MKLKIIFALLFMLPFAMVKSENLQQKFDKQVFYATMDSGKLAEVNTELDNIAALTFKEKEGYEGALLMRKADLVAIPAEKLKFFKAGRIKLETALQSDNDNAEFHFLRFAIQEHAPKIVKYHTQLEEDRQFILKAYKNMQPVVQHAIVDYTKKSKLLHEQDL
jgi:hypothetical protein